MQRSEAKESSKSTPFSVTATESSTASSRATALIPRGAYLTLGDLFALEWPHLSDEDKDFALYEFTGFPCFWETDNPISELRQQMRNFRSGVAYQLPIGAAE